MRFNKFENNSYCVGGRHLSKTLNIKGDVTSNGRKMLVGKCANCSRIAFMNKTIRISFNFLKAHLIVYILTICRVKVNVSPLKSTFSFLSSSK